MSEELLFNPQTLRVFITLALYVLLPVVIIEIFKRKMWMQRCGTVVAAYAAGLVMALTGLTSLPQDSMEEMMFGEWQSLMMNLSVTLAIPLMLFKCDFRLWTRALPKTIVALIGGVIAVTIAVVSGFYLLRDRGIPEAGKVSAMLTGMYTGGTMNFNALGTMLNMDKTVMGLVLAFDMLLTVPLLFFILGGGYKLLRRWLPYQDETTPAFRRREKTLPPPVQDVEDYDGIFTRDNFPGLAAGLGLSLLFLAVGAGVSYLLWKTGIVPPDTENPDKPVISELAVILTITTLSVAASFFRSVRELPKTFEAGMFFILIFSVILASMFDWHSIGSHTWGIGLFILWIILCSMLLHWLFY